MKKLLDLLRYPFQSKVWKWFIDNAEKFEHYQTHYGTERYVMIDRFGNIRYCAWVTNGICRIYTADEKCVLTGREANSFSRIMADKLSNSL